MGDNEPVMSPARPAKTDAALAAAVDVAREALAEAVGSDQFGEHLGVVAEADRVVTHFFATVQGGYGGWRWAVTVTRAPRQKHVTINEIVMLPGDSALLAPEWVPWKDRVGKGDLGPGDLVPVAEDDPRLVPGYLVGDEPIDAAAARDQREVVREVGLGRERVLSVTGRDDAADRWYTGDNGPEAPIAQAAPGRCGTCGFLVRISGPLGTMFGICANLASPSDGQAVSFDHGCGAHSGVHVEQSQHQPSTTMPVFDTVTWDTLADDWADSELEIIPR
ncbi:MAG: DUF3027 domain-containing protein [Nocardioidaceae bacterium]